MSRLTQGLPWLSVPAALNQAVPILARCKDPEPVQGREPQTPEEIRACKHVQSVFGWTAESIRPLAPGDRRNGPFAVRVAGVLHNSLEFIYAEGLLVGMPSGRRKS